MVAVQTQGELALIPLPHRPTTRRIEAQYVCEDPQGKRHVVLQVRHVVTFAFGSRRWEVPASREFVLDGDTTGRGVTVLKEGRVFRIADNRTILRRVGGY